LFNVAIKGHALAPRRPRIRFVRIWGKVALAPKALAQAIAPESAGSPY